MMVWSLNPNQSLNQLQGNPANPRCITPAGRAVLQGHLHQFGNVGTLVARRLDDGTLRVISGNQRLAELLATGVLTAPTYIGVCTDIEEQHLAVVLNGHAGTWDEQALTELMRSLAASGVDLGALGLEMDHALERALEAVHGTASGPVDPDEPAALEIGPAVSIPGTIYELGRHRLLCGDSTDAAVWASLMQPAERVDLVWTDPPYGVAYKGAAGSILNDDLDEDGLTTLLRASLGHALRHCCPGAVWYVAAPGGPLFQVFGTVLRELGIWRQTLVLVKDAFVLGHSDYHHCHEPIFHGAVPDDLADSLLYGWAPDGRRTWRGGRAQDTAWHIPRPKRSIDHPTMKPLALVERAITNSSLAGDLVCDPFGGSGTTLIAAERTNRRAYLIELDPRYCDAIRRRWTRHAADAGITPGTGALV